MSDLLSVKNAAEKLNISTRTVHRLLKQGNFPNAFKTSRANNAHWRIPESDLVDYQNRMVLSAKGWVHESF